MCVCFICLNGTSKAVPGKHQVRLRSSKAEPQTLPVEPQAVPGEHPTRLRPTKAEPRRFSLARATAGCSSQATLRPRRSTPATWVTNSKEHFLNSSANAPGVQDFSPPPDSWNAPQEPVWKSKTSRGCRYAVKQKRPDGHTGKKITVRESCIPCAVVGDTDAWPAPK